MTHPLIDVARRSVEASLEHHRYLPPGLDEPWRAPRPVFVTLRSPDGSLRGCIGHLSATRDTLAEEVAECAVLAASEDPRFPPVTQGELDGLTWEISVLEDPKPCSRADLDPRRYGVVVTSGRRRGVLLPDLDGVDTVDDQLSIACRKAGIFAGEPLSLERFEVLKIEEETSP
jgi:AmmeMemoRadiSam system protein A